CQMTNAEFDQVAVDITENKNKSIFHAVGTTRTFDGFMKVYIEDRDDNADDEGDAKLPPMNIGDAIVIDKLNPNQHFTQPPARFTEASLVKKMEELGIGRPSTYATIMSTIVDRNYVEQDKQRRFHPTEGGWVIAAYLNKYFNDLVDVNFTAKTEDVLDDVAGGRAKKIGALENFWNPTKSMIDNAKNVTTTEIIDELNANMHDHLFREGDDKCPVCGNGKLGLKLSRYGSFIGCSNYPECKHTQRLDNAADGVVHDPREDSVQNRGTDIALGNDVFYKVGRYGPYVTDGKKNVSAKGETAETITLEKALELLSAEKKGAEGIELGINPKTDNQILFYASGRYGPYISSNKVNVSVKSQPTLEEAIELINNKKPAAKRSFTKKK
ncbi:topoisomerase DNA-binding C4 zinc finger domain-containing protein, partial [Lachnospiraceae bacterium OttesenSCG-928-E19]|nr:topoisomerase DNA-binding C4 zinc finger domain-containing protein [Lachnospiraceae bacterium OttesenSCG-928-E19]